MPSMPSFRNSFVKTVLESSCITDTLRFSARPFLALTKTWTIDRKLFTRIFIAYLLSSSTTIIAGDISNGELLHNENCVRCHKPSVYTRENRMINSYDALHERVRQCEIMAEMAWFDEEIDDVVSFLNHAYYRFEDAK